MSEFGYRPERRIDTDIVGEIAMIQTEDAFEDRALLLDSLLHDMYVTGRIWGTNGEYARLTAENGCDIFLQPSVSHPTRQGGEREFYDVHTMPDGYQTDMSSYKAAGERVFRLEQCYGVRMPRTDHPDMFLTMSECSAVVGVTDQAVYAMHVGMSERDAIRKFIDLMKNDGVLPENTYVVASVGEDIFNGIKTPHYDFSKIDSVSDVVTMGVPEENVLPFEYVQNGEIGMLAGVVITSDFISRYFFDEKQPTDMHDIVTIPFDKPDGSHRE